MQYVIVCAIIRERSFFEYSGAIFEQFLSGTKCFYFFDGYAILSLTTIQLGGLLMFFDPYVISGATGDKVRVNIVAATPDILSFTQIPPKWQTDWTSKYLSNPKIKKYAVKAPNDELIALGAYEVIGKQAYVYIVYMESAPESNPTMTAPAVRKYYGIGELLLAFGIKFSIDNGCRGDIVFEAKTDELAKHYEEDFHALRLPGASTSGPARFMLADEEAWNLFSKFLSEEDV